MRSSKAGKTPVQTMELISYCVFDQKLKRIQYTGAMNDTVFIRDGELKVIAADHLSVSALTEGSGVFTMKKLMSGKGTLLYVF
jgi:hypothetical protein